MIGIFIKDKIKIKFENNENSEIIKNYFSRKINNFWFHPLVKKRVWDGTVHFFKNGFLPIGLWYELKKVCDKYGYNLNLKNIEKIYNTKYNKEDFEQFINEYFSKNNKIEIRDYQRRVIENFLIWKIGCSEIATSGGKTLISFLFFKYLKNKNYFLDDSNNNYKTLIILPNLTLVTQTLTKFIEYDIDKNIKYNVYTGDSKKEYPDGDLILGTYQTLKNLHYEYFKNVKCIIVDEAHYSKTKSIKTIIEKVKKASSLEFIHGMSGTLYHSNSDIDKFFIQETLGPIIDKISLEYLYEKNYAVPVMINMVYIDYASVDEKVTLYNTRKAKNNKGKSYEIEKEFIIKNEIRKKFLCNYLIFLLELNKNILFLFYNIKDGYGYSLYESVKEKLTNEKKINNYNIFYIDGSIKKETREYFKTKLETDNKPYLIFASYGTFSVGVDIPSINYIILGESFKSEILNKQTFGRGVRKFKNKQRVNIIDIVDDFSINNNINYVYKHSLEREKIYIKEKFNYDKRKILLDNNGNIVSIEEIK